MLRLLLNFINCNNLTSVFIPLSVACPAIMSALRGLQGRIRSLELERSQAENNLKSLATETTQYRDILQRQNTVRETTQTEISKQSQGLYIDVQIYEYLVDSN